MINIITANLAVIGAALVGLQIFAISASYNLWDYVMNKVGHFAGFYFLPFFIWLFTCGLVFILVWKFPIDEEFKVITLWPGIVLSIIILYIPVVAFFLYPYP
jgi:hypothetical protein